MKMKRIFGFPAIETPEFTEHIILVGYPLKPSHLPAAFFARLIHITYYYSFYLICKVCRISSRKWVKIANFIVFAAVGGRPSKIILHLYVGWRSGGYYYTNDS